MGEGSRRAPNALKAQGFEYPLSLLAGVAEWQTQGTQNPPLARACRFESGLRHQPLKRRAPQSLAQISLRGSRPRPTRQPLSGASEGLPFTRRLRAGLAVAVDSGRTWR